MVALVAGRVVAGKFRLERPLGHGGMGQLWVAFHLQLDTLVAIKFIDSALARSAEARRRFEREAKASAQLRSAHVVGVLDHGVDGDMPYIVMELLEGEDLSARLKRERRLPLGATAALLAQIAKGLRRAHEAGIVHRDIKPANIFIARSDDDEVVKILDFGLAKVIFADPGSEATKVGAVMGSPNYMSPEQARSTGSVDHRTDLWALGAILYRCVTGQLAFSGVSDADVIIKICTDSPLPPTHVAPDLPASMDSFFARALARDITQRFQSVRELAAEFTAIVAQFEGASPRVPLDSFASGAGPSNSPPPQVPAGTPWSAEAHSPEPAGGGGRTMELSAGDLVVERTASMPQLHTMLAERTMPLPPQEPLAPTEPPSVTSHMPLVNVVAPPRGGDAGARPRSGRVVWVVGAGIGLLIAAGAIGMGLRRLPAGAQASDSPPITSAAPASPAGTPAATAPTTPPAPSSSAEATGTSSAKVPPAPSSAPRPGLPTVPPKGTASPSATPALKSPAPSSAKPPSSKPDDRQVKERE